jgi:hypothetical protein
MLLELSLVDKYHVAEAEAIVSLLERLSLTQSSVRSYNLKEFLSLLIPCFLASFRPPSEGTLTIYPTRALPKVGVEIWAQPSDPNWSWPPPLSKDEIQRILQLREAAMHISIDFIGRSMDTYCPDEKWTCR